MVESDSFTLISANYSQFWVFQFVNFTDIMSRNVEQSRKEAEFALSALMEIPTQYQATLELNILK